MKSCLIVGGQSPFTKALIDRLDREGMRVFTLSSDKASERHDRAFEHYSYDYASENISSVVTSARPDVLIFMGAYDTCFIGDDAVTRERRRNYITALSNLLICSSMQGVRHFLYLSSECVFSDNYIADIKERMPASPITHEQMLIYQGETLALKYNKVSVMEVTVARLGSLYSLPRNAEECSDMITSMCLKALRGEALFVNEKHIMSALYESDAVEALLKLINAPSRKYTLYHIASTESFTERDLADVICVNSINPVTVQDATTGLTMQKMLSSEDFNLEFGFFARVSYRDIIPRVIRMMQTHMGDFKLEAESAKRSSAWRRLLHDSVSYIELVVGFVVTFLLTRLIGDGMPSVNLFLIYTLLFAVFYSSRHGIFAALLSSVGYCFLGLSGRTGLELLIDLNTYVWIAQVFIVGLATGNVRDQLTTVRQDMGEEIAFLSARLKNVTSINESNVQIKNFFEERMVDSDASIGHIYNIIADMDKAEHGAELFAATRILIEFMGTEDVAIYRIMNGGYSRIAASSSVRARSLGKSITMTEYPEIFGALSERRAYVNQRLDSHLPFMADTLIDSEGQVNFAVFLWDLNYDHMTQYYINLLRVVCALISNAVTRADNYMQAMAYSRMIDRTGIMRTEAFNDLIRVYTEASAHKLADYCLLSVDRGDETLEAWDQRLTAMLRHTDNLGLLNENTLGVLLTNTNVQEGSVVINRLRGKGVPAELVGGH